MNIALIVANILGNEMNAYDKFKEKEKTDRFFSFKIKQAIEDNKIDGLKLIDKGTGTYLFCNTINRKCLPISDLFLRSMSEEEFEIILERLDYKWGWK